jgi:hypothetical protein
VTNPGNDRHQAGYHRPDEPLVAEGQILEMPPPRVSTITSTRAARGSRSGAIDARVALDVRLAMSTFGGKRLGSS